jgi:long-chain acyl-CoA synthetase
MNPPKKLPKFLKTEYEPPPEKRPEPPPKKVYETIPKLIRHNFDQGADETAMCQKKFGIWKKYPWRKNYENIRQLSLGLISLGLNRRDVVCLYGDNTPEWFWGEFAAQAAGAIPAAVPVDATPAIVKYIITQANAKFAIVSGFKQVAQLLENKADLAALQKIIYWEPRGLKGNTDPRLINFNDVLKLGAEYMKANPKLFEQNIDSVAEDDIALTYYYLSGTKELPRAVRMSYRALLVPGRGFLQRCPIEPEDNLISNLPAGSAKDTFFAAMPHVLTGAALNFPEKPETVPTDTRETAPDFIFYPHEKWESLAENIRARIKDSHTSNIVKRLLNSPLLFRTLKDQLGLSKVRVALTDTGLSQDAYRLVHAIGVELRQTYANDEIGIIACQGENEIEFATVGRPIVGMEVRIGDKDELLVRSDWLFSGDAANVQKAAEVLADGWYHTGDKARINEKGHIIILKQNQAEKAERA